MTKCRRMARRKSQKHPVRKKADEYNSADSLEAFAERIYEMLPASAKTRLNKAVAKRAIEDAVKSVGSL